ncbi:initiation of DNA replication [Escherichia coli]|nr:initiation of DNA replication [Escherichia coli]
MTSLFNRLTGKAVSRTAFVEHLGQEVVQHHPNWKVMISTDHKLMRIDTGHQTVEITLDDAYKRYQAAPDPLQEVAADMLKQLAEMLPTGRCIVPVIKEKAWLDTVRQQLSQYESDPEVLNASLDFAWEDFNDELIILFAEDGSETMRYLMRYEVTIDREQAISNLKQILPEVTAEIVIQAQTMEKLPLSPQGVLMSPV